MQSDNGGEPQSTVLDKEPGQVALSMPLRGLCGAATAVPPPGREQSISHLRE